MRHLSIGAFLFLAAACGGSSGSDEPSDPGDGSGDEAPPSAERPETTAAACEAAGGSVVGDIGDGAIHRPDYRCPDGQAPTGSIPLGVEGSVCCPATSCPEGGAPPVPSPDGPPENCAVLFEGCCYQDTARACEVAGCEPDCTIMESYPGQLHRCD